MRLFALSVSALLSACAAAPEPPAMSDEQVKSRIKEAAEARTAYASFADFIRHGNYAKAHLMLSQETRRRLTVEEFVVVLNTFEVMRRMLTEAQVHDVRAEGAAGSIRVCNPEFRVSEEFHLVKEMGVYWTFDLTGDQVQRLSDGVMGWYGSRHDDGSRHAYPAGYPHPDARRDCPCRKGAVGKAS